MYNRILTAIIFLTAFSSKAFAQDFLTDAEKKASKRDTKTFSLNSLDGKKQKVHIMPDYPNHVLRISCLKATISINEFWGVPAEMHLMNKKFLKIVYEVRSGSNEDSQNTVLLCVNKGKLFESLSINSLSSYDMGDQHGSYSIRLSFKNDYKNKVTLIAYIYDDAYSKFKPKTNYNYNNQTKLNFDYDNNVFYNVKKDIYDNYMVYNFKDDKEHSRSIKGNYPVIILEDDKYFFIENEWYEAGNDKHLIQYSSHTGK